MASTHRWPELKGQDTWYVVPGYNQLSARSFIQICPIGPSNATEGLGGRDILGVKPGSQQNTIFREEIPEQTVKRDQRRTWTADWDGAPRI